MPNYPAPEPEQDKGYPSASRANRFGEDRFLRLCGFEIHERRGNREPRWRRRGSVYGHREALWLARKERKKKGDGDADN